MDLKRDAFLHRGLKKRFPRNHSAQSEHFLNQGISNHMSQPEASRLANKALALWGDNQAELAISLYTEVLELTDPSHYMTPIYHEQFAGALSSCGRYDEAQQHFQRAVSLELEQGSDNFSPSLVVARYLLAEHFLQQGNIPAALETIEPSFREGTRQEWLLRYIKALSFHALGDQVAARNEAHLALKCAPSEAKQQELLEIFNKKIGLD